MPIHAYVLGSPTSKKQPYWGLMFTGFCAKTYVSDQRHRPPTKVAVFCLEIYWDDPTGPGPLMMTWMFPERATATLHHRYPDKIPSTKQTSEWKVLCKQHVAKGKSQLHRLAGLVRSVPEVLVYPKG